MPDKIGAEIPDRADHPVEITVGLMNNDIPDGPGNCAILVANAVTQQSITAIGSGKPVAMADAGKQTMPTDQLMIAFVFLHIGIELLTFQTCRYLDDKIAAGRVLIAVTYPPPVDKKVIG